MKKLVGILVMTLLIVTFLPTMGAKNVNIFDEKVDSEINSLESSKKINEIMKLPPLDDFEPLGWSPGDMQLISEGSNTESSYASIAIDDNGGVHVVWSDDSGLMGSGPDYDIYYRNKTSRDVWSPIQLVSGESNDDSIFTSIAVDSETVHVVWQDRSDIQDAGIDYDIFYKNKSINAWSWLHDVEVVSIDCDGHSYHPSIAVDSETVHVAWSDSSEINGAGIDRDIFYSKRESGTGWNPIRLVSELSTGDSEYPSLAVETGGAPHIVWQDETYDPIHGADFDIKYAYGFSSGRFHECGFVSTESWEDSTNPSFVIEDDSIMHIAWQDNSDYDGSGSDSDIFYKTGPLKNELWSHNRTNVISTESTETSLSASIVVYNNEIHIVWSDQTPYKGAGPDSDIFYKNMNSLGWKDAEVIAIESSGASFEPKIGINPYDGRKHIIWSDSSDFQGAGTDFDIFYKMHSGNLDLKITKPYEGFYVGNLYLFDIGPLVPDQYPPFSVVLFGLPTITADLYSSGVGDRANRVEFSLLDVQNFQPIDTHVDSFPPYEWSSWPGLRSTGYIIAAVAFSVYDEALAGDLVAVYKLF